jgi:hypothetical protein
LPKETNFIKNVMSVTSKAVGGYSWIIIEKKYALTGVAV